MKISNAYKNLSTTIDIEMNKNKVDINSILSFRIEKKIFL
jgi:hypothetical protein